MTDDGAFQQQPFGGDSCYFSTILGQWAGSPYSSSTRDFSIFETSLHADQLASKRVDVAVVPFGPVRVETDFTNVLHFVPPTLSAAADTPMLDATSIALPR
jgi:hypothetical protein